MVLGFCQLKPYSQMATLDHTVEALTRNKRQLLASISADNATSLRFHAKHGFVECGRFLRIGNKFGRDFDIVFLLKRL